MNVLRPLSLLFVTALVVLSLPATVRSTPDYARQTGKECSFCHEDAGGGGRLTPAGKRFLEDLRAKGLARRLSPGRHVVRLMVGYVHMMAGILWFGTILYVHLLLKPAYASKGLPRGELRLGWISMALVLITGTLLTIARMPSLEAFTATRFGILLTVKIALFLVMLASALITTVYIGPRLRKKLKSPPAAVLSRHMTPEQLGGFDGREGRPAYIACKGRVYDVTNSRLWMNGVHAMKHLAGNDLTEALRNAPHGEDKILAMPQAGMLAAADRKPERPFHERLFYFFAYLNLTLVFVIVFIISLWRWW